MMAIKKSNQDTILSHLSDYSILTINKNGGVHLKWLIPVNKAFILRLTVEFQHDGIILDRGFNMLKWSEIMVPDFGKNATLVSSLQSMMC